MNINKIESGNQLYTKFYTLYKAPENKESYVFNMITKITENTSPIEFEAEWKKNSDFKLEMRGPNGPCLGGTCLHMAVHKNNLTLTKYFIKLLNNHVDFLNCIDVTPLKFAINNISMSGLKNNKELQIIEELIKASADVNLVSDYDTILCCATRNLETTKLLLQYGAVRAHGFTHDRKGLIKEKFPEENFPKTRMMIYKQAKNEIKKQNALFILGGKDNNSLISFLPKEIIAHILTCARIESPNQKKIRQAKKEITYPQILFALAGKDSDSLVSHLPKEIIGHILQSSKVNLYPQEV